MFLFCCIAATACRVAPRARVFHAESAKLDDPDANEAKPWRVQWKEGGERLASRRSRDEVRVLEPLARRAADAS